MRAIFGETRHLPFVVALVCALFGAPVSVSGASRPADVASDTSDGTAQHRLQGAPVQPRSAGAIDDDFRRRRSGPGVIRWFDFDGAAQLGPVARSGNFSAMPGTSTSPVIDNAVAASGRGSLRFDIPSRSGANAAGSWYANFSDDLATQFGENSEFYIQWRQRFNRAFVNTFFAQAGSGGQRPTGIKQVIVTAGDQPGRRFASCEAIGVVITSHYQHRFSTAYDSCTGSGSHGPYAGLYAKARPPAYFLLQNAFAPASCPYGGLRGNPTSAPPTCFGWEVDQWMTFQIGITLGPRDNLKNEFQNSRFRLWAAREGEPSQLIIDWQPGVSGYFPLTAGPLAQNQRYGKVYLLPYMTNKDASQEHDLAQTWYDELIISTQRIPDPAPGAHAAR